jgi:hypothetical protein
VSSCRKAQTLCENNSYVKANAARSKKKFCSFYDGLYFLVLLHCSNEFNHSRPTSYQQPALGPLQFYINP